MSRFDPFYNAITESVTNDELLSAALLPVPQWLDDNLPPEPGTGVGFPCIRTQLVSSRNSRQGEYIFAISLWVETDNSADKTDEFHALALAFEDALNASNCIISPGGYLNRPEPQNGLNRALWSVVFVAGR